MNNRQIVDAARYFPTRRKCRLKNVARVLPKREDPPSPTLSPVAVVGSPELVALEISAPSLSWTSHAPACPNRFNTWLLRDGCRLYEAYENRARSSLPKAYVRTH